MKTINITTEELHDNFVLIHETIESEPLKKWVKSDPDYVGNYHDNYEVLMEAVEKICDLPPPANISTWGSRPFDVIINTSFAHFTVDCQKVKFLPCCMGSSLKNSIYMAVVNFCKWYKSAN